jgi:hypothetical protein
MPFDPARDPPRFWLAVALAVAGLGLVSGSAHAAQASVAVLPSAALEAGLRAPLVQAVSQAVSAAQLTLIGAAELDTILQGESALRGCTTPTCLERLGRLLNATALIRFAATAQSTAAGKATYQLQVDSFNIEVGAQAANMTSTCASCTTGEAAQALRELTKQVLASDAARPRGTLAIETTPPSATVFVDGNDSGLTPYQRPAFVGTHTIVLRATGYSSQQASISVTEGHTSRLDVRLMTGLDAPAVADSAAKPVYKKWWFWVIVGGAAVAAAAVTTGIVVSQPSGPTEPAHATNHISF